MQSKGAFGESYDMRQPHTFTPSGKENLSNTPVTPIKEENLSKHSERRLGGLSTHTPELEHKLRDRDRDEERSIGGGIEQEGEGEAELEVEERLMRKTNMNMTGGFIHLHLENEDLSSNVQNKENFIQHTFNVFNRDFPTTSAFVEG